MTGTLSQKEITKKFASHKLSCTPSAIERIQDEDKDEELVEYIVGHISDDVSTVDGDVIEEFIDEFSVEDETTDDTDGSESSEDEDEDDDGFIQDSAGFDDIDGRKKSEQMDEGVAADPVPDEGTISKEDHSVSPDEASPEFHDSDDGRVYIMGGDAVHGDTPEERWDDIWADVLVEPPLPSAVSREVGNRSVSISGDISGKSRTTGTEEDFQRLFRDRFKRLRSILKERMPPCSTIESLDDRRQAGKETGVIGIVNEVRKTKNGHDLIELEDTTGTFPVLFSEGYTDERVKELIERVIADEVIGVVGSVSDDNGILFGDELYFPDVPPMRTPNTSERSVKAVLLSDLHFGAVDFAAEEWKNFVNWMRTSDEAADVEYVLIAGDLVEGIGVYPGQEEELGVVDIYDQYALCAEALDQLPSDVDIYTIMGNHDRVRLAEPQPVLKETFMEPFGDNVHFAGNPATVTVEGVEFLLYHGMSLNPFTDRTPGLDIHEPTGAMEVMLEKRHLAPMYGMNVRLAPEREDYLLIEDVPDVLHTGHVHTFGIDSYKDVLMVNTGCWQYQTDFQRKLNVEPDVGYAPVIDLDTLNIDVKGF